MHGTFSTNKELIVKKIAYNGVESEMQGGIAVASQRYRLAETTLLVGYKLPDGTVLSRGDKVMIRGASVLKPWAKNTLVLPSNEEGVALPEAEVVAYQVVAK
jgi:hypothetical protein